jgi:hypothetical protein
VIVLLLVTLTFVAAAVPKVTLAPETKLVPVMVTFVPPAVEPLFGETLVTVGAFVLGVVAVAIFDHPLRFPA